MLKASLGYRERPCFFVPVLKQDLSTLRLSLGGEFRGTRLSASGFSCGDRDFNLLILFSALPRGFCVVSSKHGCPQHHGRQVASRTVSRCPRQQSSNCCCLLERGLRNHFCHILMMTDNAQIHLVLKERKLHSTPQ